MARVHLTGTIMASFCVCSSALYMHAFSADLPAAYGRDDKTLPHQHLQACTGELQEDLFSHPQSQGVTTNKRARATQEAQIPQQTASPGPEQVPMSQQTSAPQQIPAPQQTPAPQPPRTARHAKHFKGLSGLDIVLGALGVVVLVVLVLPH